MITMTAASLMPVQGVDPGVCRLVDLLRAAGFRTTDSGDGVSKPADHRSMDVPHVAIRAASGEHVIEEAQRLADLLARAGVDLDREGVGIQASWSPLDGVAVVLLTGVSDADLGGTP